MWVALQLSMPKGEVGAYVRANASAYTCASMCLQTLRSFYAVLAYSHGNFACACVCTCLNVCTLARIFLQTLRIHMR